MSNYMALVMARTQRSNSRYDGMSKPMAIYTLKHLIIQLIKMQVSAVLEEITFDISKPTQKEE